MSAMFDWLKRLDPEVRGLEMMSSKFEQMLEDGRHVFDLAANALLGGTDPEVIRNDLFETDGRINATEQSIRRKIVVHGSVHGSGNLPELLILMSLVKDAERIGDYAKNIFDLVVRDPNLGDSEERARLVDCKDRVSRTLVKARNLYHERDESAAMMIISEIDGIQNECDGRIHALLEADDGNMAGAVLTYRYFKRIVSHTSNIASSLVMPVDKLDFFDEPKVE